MFTTNKLQLKVKHNVIFFYQITHCKSVVCTVPTCLLYALLTTSRHDPDEMVCGVWAGSPPSPGSGISELLDSLVLLIAASSTNKYINWIQVWGT